MVTFKKDADSGRLEGSTEGVLAGLVQREILPPTLLLVLFTFPLLRLGAVADAEDDYEDDVCSTAAEPPDPSVDGCTHTQIHI